MTNDEIFTKIRDVLVDALGVDEEDVSLDAQLAADLGAESIDFLDIQFKLEQAFGFKIPQGEMFPDNVAQDPTFVQEGKVTPKGLAELRSRLPHFDFAGFEADPQLTKLGQIFTVRALVKYVERKLNAGVGSTV
jgi:acyl carrier protein